MPDSTTTRGVPMAGCNVLLGVAQRRLPLPHRNKGGVLSLQCLLQGALQHHRRARDKLGSPVHVPCQYASPHLNHVGLQIVEHAAYSLHLPLDKAVEQHGLGVSGD